MNKRFPFKNDNQAPIVSSDNKSFGGESMLRRIFLQADPMVFERAGDMNVLYLNLSALQHIFINYIYFISVLFNKFPFAL